MSEARDPVVVRVIPNGAYRFECLVCGDNYIPMLPVPIDMFIAQMDAFGQRHEECRKSVVYSSANYP